MPSESNVRLRTRSDPVALRAFAHPLRLRLYDLVAREGTLTAADAARQLGISHGLASHHLRQLAKYAFVEPADAEDARAHPWRVTSTDLSFAPLEPSARAATDVLEQHAVEEAAAQLAAWHARRDGVDAAWHDAAGVGSSLLYLTPDELDRLLQAWSDLVLPLARRRPIGHHEDRPADAEPVAITLVRVPVPRTEQGG